MASSSYHHGDLANAVIEAGLRRVRQRGLDAVSGRELAGVVGVAPSAIYRHFADKDQLRAAIAQAAREQLARAMSQPKARKLTKASAYARFRAIGEAYIDFALSEPRLYAAAFSDCRPSREDSPSGWSILAEALDALVATGAMPRSRRAGAELVAWSAAHGISDLLLSPYLEIHLKSDRRRMTKVVLDGVMQSLQISR
jgi:AcrR family transcriptional regulator